MNAITSPAKFTPTNLISWDYNENEPLGSYKFVWLSQTQIDTVQIKFDFYNAGGTLLSTTVNAPLQNPTIVGKIIGWEETDVQPDYLPSGAVFIRETVYGADSGDLDAQVWAKATCT